MSHEDLNLLVAILSFFVALFATAVSVVAIRRDRADLRVTAVSPALGNRYLSVVNVGARPLRIEQLVVERWRFVRFRPATRTVRALASARLEEGMVEHDLPVIVQPAEAIVLHYAIPDFDEWVDGYSWDLVVEDAAGHRYAVPYAKRYREMGDLVDEDV